MSSSAVETNGPKNHWKWVDWNTFRLAVYSDSGVFKGWIYRYCKESDPDSCLSMIFVPE